MGQRAGARDASTVDTGALPPAPRRSLFLSNLLLAGVPALLSGAGAYLLARLGWDGAVLAIAALAIAGLALAGARLQERRVSRPVRALAARADQISAAHSGSVPAAGRAELADLVRSFDAMTGALQATIERLRADLGAATQDAVDLQRRYALMQLLRNLAVLGNEDDTPAQALHEALAEIGAYLDWPLARLGLVIQEAGAPAVLQDVHWYDADPPRHRSFIEACAAADAAADADADGATDRARGMLGMALRSTLPHWVTDLARLEAWTPLSAAQACGLRSGFVVPVAVAPGITAVLEFYAAHRIEAGDEMLELVEAISVELWRSVKRLAAAAGVRQPDAQTRRLALVAERMAEAVLVTGSDGRVAWTNPALLQMLGRSASQCLGREVPQLLFPRDPLSAGLCRRRLESGERVTGLVLGARADDGADRTYEIEIESLPEPGADAASARAGRFLLVRDISHDRATQDALNAALEAARQASQSKSQFLANMSHEIRTPMNGVLGMAELLLGTALDERQRRYIESLYRSGEALLDILNDILDFSKIEAGKLELQAVDFDLHALTGDLVELLAPRAHQKRIELAYRLAPDLPKVAHGDPTRLRQVLINVVGNAIKFTEHGEVVLGVQALAQDDGSSRVRFEVRDTGIGMPAEAVERLFTIFMQADPSSSRRYGGTGLGLAISRQLTELMGGRISAHSRVGEGSTFCIDLPLRPGLGPAPARPAAAVADLARRRVLIVEDNPTNRGILEEQLRGAGMDCASVGNGQQALTRLREALRAHRPFELAVVDMKMPVMDGLTLVERVREEPLLNALRLVMLTSISGRDDARRAHELGVDAYLSKPVRQQELLACLAGALQRPAPEPEPVPGAPAPRPALAGRRILVVEDNLVNQEVARAMLDRFGCISTLVGDGAAALDLLARTAFDVILMDCQMPVLDGFETLRRLRAPPAPPDDARHPVNVARRTPVIALTANALSGDAERCRAAGFTDYLAKPFRQEELAQLLTHWVGRALPGPAVGAAVGAPVADASAAGTGAGSAVLDPRVLEQIRAMERNGAHDLVRRLVRVYETSSAELVAAAAQAVAQSDAEALARSLHTLKSSSASLGALRLARACNELCTLARRAELAQAAQRWAALRAEYDLALDALRQLMPAPAVEDAPLAVR